MGAAQDGVATLIILIWLPVLTVQTFVPFCIQRKGV